MRRATATAASYCGGSTGGSSGGSIGFPSLSPQALDLVEHGLGDLRLARPRHGPLSVRGEDHDLVVRRIEADVRARDVIDHHGVEVLALELPTTVVERPRAVFRGEADQRLPLTPPRPESAEDIVGRLELDCGRQPSILLELV